MGLGVIVPVVFVLMILVSMLRVLNEYERGVVFRLGRMIGVKGPGLIILIPVLDTDNWLVLQKVLQTLLHFVLNKLLNELS